MQFLRLIFVKKLQGFRPLTPTRGVAPWIPTEGLLRPPGPTFQLTFPFLIPMPVSCIWYMLTGCGRCVALLAAEILTILAFASPYWARDDDMAFGLWRKARCDPGSSGPDRQDCSRTDFPWHGSGEWRLMMMMMVITPAMIVMILLLLLLLLRSPAIYLGFTIFGARFLRMWPFFNPTIKVVTFRLRGWWVLGVFLLPAFSRLGYERQDFLSPCDEMHVCSD